MQPLAVRPRDGNALRWASETEPVRRYPEMAIPIIVGNWKMNTSNDEANDLVLRMKSELEGTGGVEVVICPPLTALASVRELLRGSGIGLGAQNMHHAASGAYTGEVSAAMLSGLCQFVILGHSERRQLFGETDLAVGKKVEAASAAGIRPIMCVGERLEDREDGTADAIVEQQVRLGLARTGSPGGLLVAYEPVWAIGTGRAATPEDAQGMMAHIRRLLATQYGDEAASSVPLLYGGSVTADNVGVFVGEPDIDGALVGGASLKAESFVELARSAAQASSQTSA